VALSFFVVLPLTLRFLLGLQAGSLTPMITATDYFGFAATMSLMFGVVFELPIAILALTILGIVTPAFLIRYRKHSVVLCLVVGGVHHTWRRSGLDARAGTAAVPAVRGEHRRVVGRLPTAAATRLSAWLTP
jgi:hypothetical protein